MTERIVKRVISTTQPNRRTTMLGFSIDRIISLDTRLMGFCVVLLCACGGISAHGQEDQAIVLKTVGGPELRVPQLEINPEGVLSGGEIPSGTTLDDLRSIAFAKTPATSRGPYQVRFRGGSFLYVSNLSLVDEQCRFQYAGETYALPIESLQAVQLDTSRNDEAFEKGAADPLAEVDRLYLKIEDQLQSVTGIVESVESGKVTFVFDDQSRELRMDQVFGFVIADFEAEPVKPGNAEIQLTDGSRLQGRLSELANGVLRVNIGGDTEVAIGIPVIQRVELSSDRLLFLSDVEPTRSQMTPIVTIPRQWQRDRSVGGNPLTLAQGSSNQTMTYEKGIGTHAESTLEFANSGGFDRFVAMIGIDAETNGKGDCQFVVLGDGETLFERRMQGKDEPFLVNVDISGKKTISLVVLAGEQLDLADHANWCEARFLKSQE